MNRRRFSAIGHTDHVFLSPVSDAKIERLIDLCDLQPGARVVDLGCGKGELVARIVERYEADGEGIDNSPFFLDIAWARAARVRRGKLIVRSADAADVNLEPASVDLGLCVGSTFILGGLRGTLRRFASLLKPGALALIGEGYWKKEPHADYLALLGGTRDELGSHASNVATLEDEGFTPLYQCVASEDDWDHYEGLYLRGVERFAHANPDDVDRHAMLERIRRWRDGYLKHGRDTLGFGFYLARK
jgi:SAM-dependent methyltransferase